MNQWLLIGVLVILAANYVQIIEEWATRGLTDTSYKVCCLLVGGPLCSAWGFESQGSRELAWVFVGLAICAGAMIYMKLRDLIRTRYRLG